MNHKTTLSGVLLILVLTLCGCATAFAGSGALKLSDRPVVSLETTESEEPEESQEPTETDGTEYPSSMTEEPTLPSELPAAPSNTPDTQTKMPTIQVNEPEPSAISVPSETEQSSSEWIGIEPDPDVFPGAPASSYYGYNTETDLSAFDIGIRSVSVAREPDKKVYHYGEMLDLSGLVVAVETIDGEQRYLKPEGVFYDLFSLAYDTTIDEPGKPASVLFLTDGSHSAMITARNLSIPIYIICNREAVYSKSCLFNVFADRDEGAYPTSFEVSTYYCSYVGAPAVDCVRDINVFYSDGSTEWVDPWDGAVFSPNVFTSVGSGIPVTVNYRGISNVFYINVRPVAEYELYPESVTVTNPSVIVEDGTVLNPDLFRITDYGLAEPVRLIPDEEYLFSPAVAYYKDAETTTGDYGILPVTVSVRNTSIQLNVLIKKP